LAERRRRLESGDDVVVGVNRFTETEPSPLTAAGAIAVEQVHPEVEEAAVAAIAEWRAKRDPSEVDAALAELRRAAATNDNLMPSTLECVRAGVTTGEWSGALREVFGEYRAPTGLAGAGASSTGAETLAAVRARVAATAADLGAARLRLLVGKPGLDGHSNGAEQIAVRARDAGFEVIYQGIRLTPAEIVAAATEEGVDLVGLSVLSGSHLRAVPDVLAGLRAAGLDVPLVVGGIIPPEDGEVLRAAGVARVFTNKDFALTTIIDEMVTVIREANGLPS
jgi:(2R)-ethylmalonyl-CoA mutase